MKCTPPPTQPPTHCCLQPPIRVEYKLNQSGAAAAACDTSLSNTLMPSNCLWRPLPVCFSLHGQPHLGQRCPSAPRLYYRWRFIPHVAFRRRPPSCGLRLSKSGGIERATGVRRSGDVRPMALTLAASLQALWFCFFCLFFHASSSP